MSTAEFNAGGNPAMDQHHIQGGVEIFVIASCYRNRDRLQPGKRLGSNGTRMQTFFLPFYVPLK